MNARTLVLPIVLSLAVFGGLTACSAGGGLDTPTGVAKAYLEAASKGEVDDVMALTDSSARPMHFATPDVDTPISEIEVGEEVQKGELTQVTVSYSIGAERHQAELTLLEAKQDGVRTFGWPNL